MKRVEYTRALWRQKEAEERMRRVYRPASTYFTSRAALSALVPEQARVPAWLAQASPGPIVSVLPVACGRRAPILVRAGR